VKKTLVEERFVILSPQKGKQYLPKFPNHLAFWAMFRHKSAQMAM